MTSPHDTSDAVADTLTGGPRRGPGHVRTGFGRGVPLPLLVPALVGLAFLVLPLIALLVRTPGTACRAS